MVIGELAKGQAFHPLPSHLTQENTQVQRAESHSSANTLVFTVGLQGKFGNADTQLNLKNRKG